MQDVMSEAKAKEICSHLEETAEMMGVKLSKNVDSVELLEGILLSLKESGNQGSISGGLFMVGVYLGEILRSSVGGEWVYSEQDKQLSVDCNGELVFPMDKVRKFLSNPENEGLEFYVKALVAQLTKAKS